MRLVSVILQLVFFVVLVSAVHADMNQVAGKASPVLLSTNGSAAGDPLGENEPALSSRPGMIGYCGPLTMVFVGQMDVALSGDRSADANIHGPPLFVARYGLCHRLSRLLLRRTAIVHLQRLSRRTLHTTVAFLRSSCTRIESHCRPCKGVAVMLMLGIGIRLFSSLDPIRRALSFLRARGETNGARCLGCQLHGQVFVAGSSLESRLTPLLL